MMKKITKKQKLQTYLKNNAEWIYLEHLQDRFPGYSRLRATLHEWEQKGWVEMDGRGMTRCVRWVKAPIDIEMNRSSEL